MLYFGMWRAFFAWHKEDMDLFSINYLHVGEDKVWYVLPASKAQAFERYAATAFPEERMRCKEFLRHKHVLISPTQLKKVCWTPFPLSETRAPPR